MQRIEVSAAGRQRNDVVKAVALLRDAHERIAEKGCWTKNVLARDRHSHQVAPTSPRAARFCAAGAILRADAEQNGTVYNFVPEQVPFDVPAPVEIALDALMITATAEAGLVLVPYGEFERLSQLLADLQALAPEAAAKCEQFFAPPAKDGPCLEWYQLAVGVNDLPEIRHPQILRALTTAAERLEADLAAAA